MDRLGKTTNMRKIVKFLTSLFFTCTLIFANNASFDELKNSYLDFNTIWFKSLKNYKDYEKLQNKYNLIEYNIENAKKKNDLHIISKYQEELSVINNNLIYMNTKQNLRFLSFLLHLKVF